MIRAIKITIAAISLASCAPQLVRMDYAEYLEKQSTLRKFTEPTKKSKLYVANIEESRGGALIAYSSIEMNLSILYPKSFHAFCLPPGDYSFVYKIGFMESTPLAIHLEH
ncbi:hypothetical protein [Magnetospirillum gryphiswaldense]|uniref:hypothetical protein n=1 Tax=Magnetospirillum gryphiswaldense TaxID=55518 RepID=UPI00131A20EB|nr:hypothetical protein [Magnetospirillum gryphiswaldense]